MHALSSSAISENAILRKIRKTLARSKYVLPMLLASLIGISTGFIAVGFIKTIGWMTHTFFGPGHILSELGPYSVLLIPAGIGLAVGPMVTYWAPEAKGHGVPEVLKAIALCGGRMRPVVVIIKAVASVLTIGSGFSVGREGPIVQVGSALGASCAQALRLNESVIKNLVACGAAAGIASVFNAPIAGVMFASEVILRDFAAGTLSTVVVAAVSSSVISRIFLGASPAFSIPAYTLRSPFEMFIFLAVGILSGFAALLFMVGLHEAEHFFERWKFPDWLKVSVGGLVVGGIGLFYPQVFGTGLPIIQQALHGNMAFNLLMVLFFVKVFATAVSLGSGSSGGVFSPALFMGAMLGGSVGYMVQHVFPFPVTAPGAYAMVGMACVFSAAARAPVTAILIVLELTDGYGMILPIMVAVVVATLIAQLFIKESIYTMKLKEHGIDIGFLEEVRALGGLQVKDAMHTDFEIIPNTMSIKDLVAMMSDQKNKVVFTRDAHGQIIGMIKLEEVQKIIFMDDIEMMIAEDVATPVDDYAFPDEPLNETARHMAARGQTHIPVVDPVDTGKVIGVLHSEDIFRVYAHQVQRRSDLVDGVEQEEFHPAELMSASFTVSFRSSLSGKLIKDLDLPPGVRFSSIKRNKHFLVPQGDVALRVNDRVWATFMPDSEAALRQWLKGHKVS